MPVRVNRDHDVSPTPWQARWRPDFAIHVLEGELSVHIWLRRPPAAVSKANSAQLPGL